MIILKKGYTLEVVSWENDGDNYNTKSYTFDLDKKDEAIAVLQMCKDIFVSCNNGDGGIGNKMVFRDDQKEIILKYMKSHPELCGSYTEDADLIQICIEWNYTLLGSSVFYEFRVFESGVVLYSPEDIEVDRIA